MRPKQQQPKKLQMNNKEMRKQIWIKTEGHLVTKNNNKAMSKEESFAHQKCLLLESSKNQAN